MFVFKSIYIFIIFEFFFQSSLKRGNIKNDQQSGNLEGKLPIFSSLFDKIKTRKNVKLTAETNI